MTAPSASVTVPPLTMKSPAVALPSTVTLPPLTVQSTGATLAATTTVPVVTVTLLTVALPLDEVRSSCTLLAASIAVLDVAFAPSMSSVTITELLGAAELTACNAVETAVLDVVWMVTEPSEDDGALLTTDWMLVSFAVSTVTELVSVLATKSAELLV